MARHANYSTAARPPISIMTCIKKKKNTNISISKVRHNGLLSAKLLLRTRSRESYFEGKLGVNLKAIHVESIENVKCIGGNATKKKRETRDGDLKLSASQK